MKTYRQFKKQLLRTVIAGALLGVSAGAYAATVSLAVKGMSNITVESNCLAVFTLAGSICGSDKKCTLSKDFPAHATFKHASRSELRNWCGVKTAILTFHNSAGKKLAAIYYNPDAGKGDLLSIPYQDPSIAISWDDASITLSPK